MQESLDSETPKFASQPIFEKVDKDNYSDLYSCASLLVKEYSKEKKGRVPYMDDTISNRWMIFEDYIVRRQTVFVAKCNGNVIATLSVIPDSVDFGLPVDFVFPETEQLRRLGKRSEIGNLAASGLQGCKVLEPLMAFALYYICSKGVKITYIMVNTRHCDFYENRAKFQVMFGGQTRPCPKVNNTQAVLLALTMDSIHSNQYIQNAILNFKLPIEHMVQD